MWIQEWVDERYGVPNTVNRQVYEDFAKEVERREGERIALDIGGRPWKSIKNSSDVWVRFSLEDIQALKGESNGEE